jgi:hypothetical protein
MVHFVTSNEIFRNLVKPKLYDRFSAGLKTCSLVSS